MGWDDFHMAPDCLGGGWSEVPPHHRLSSRLMSHLPFHALHLLDFLRFDSYTQLRAPVTGMGLSTGLIHHVLVNHEFYCDHIETTHFKNTGPRR